MKSKKMLIIIFMIFFTCINLNYAQKNKNNTLKTYFYKFENDTLLQNLKVKYI